MYQTAQTLRLERDAAQRECAELRERIAADIEAFHASQCKGVWATYCTCNDAELIAWGTP